MNDVYISAASIALCVEAIKKVFKIKSKKICRLIVLLLGVLCGLLKGGGWQSAVIHVISCSGLSYMLYDNIKLVIDTVKKLFVSSFGGTVASDETKIEGGK